jgi:hypothetical protein
VPGPGSTASRIGCLLLAFALCSSCRREDARLQQHQEKFASLAATTNAIANAWLAGHVSGTYGHTALEQTFMLLEQERSDLASSPRSLADSRGARMSQDAERLSRALASMIHDIDGADAAAVRQRLHDIPRLSTTQQ